MNFFVFGCPAGDSKLPCLTESLLADIRWRGDLLTSWVLLVTFGDLLVPFGDLFLMSGDQEVDDNLLLTSGDRCLTSGDTCLTPGDLFWAMSCELPAAVPFIVPGEPCSGETCIAVVKDCVIGCNPPFISNLKSLETLPLPFFSDSGPDIYLSLLTADDCTRLPGDIDFGVCTFPNRLADDDGRLELLAGDAFCGVVFSLLCLPAAVPICGLSGVALCHKHPSWFYKIRVTMILYNRQQISGTQLQKHSYRKYYQYKCKNVSCNKK